MGSRAITLLFQVGIATRYPRSFYQKDKCMMEDSIEHREPCV